MDNVVTKDTTWTSERRECNVGCKIMQRDSVVLVVIQS
jgi:hypothetical protein